MKRNNAFFAAAISVFALTGVTLTGCSDKTEQAASNTVEGAAQDAANHTAAAGQAVEKTGEAVADGAQDAAVATGQAVEKTGEAVAAGAAKTGRAVEKSAEYAGEAVGGAVKGVGKEANDIAQIAKMTPLVKDALIRSKVDADTIDVDTSGEKDTVTLKGTVKSEAMKKTAGMSAMNAIKGAGESFKVKNQLQVVP